MKKLLIVALLLTSAPAFADLSNHPQRHEDYQSGRMANEKAHRSQVVNNRISELQHKLSCLQAAQSCINHASSMDSLNRCSTGCSR